MSQSDVQAVIAKAVKDEPYRLLLFSDPSKAIAGYNLTADEVTMLSNLNEDNFDDFAGGLDDRTTKGTWFPGG